MEGSSEHSSLTVSHGFSYRTLLGGASIHVSLADLMLPMPLSLFPNLALPLRLSIFLVPKMSLSTFVALSIGEFVSPVEHVIRLCDLVNSNLPSFRLHHIHCSSQDLLTPHIPMIFSITDLPLGNAFLLNGGAVAYRSKTQTVYCGQDGEVSACRFIWA
jgi:hypothetical protein